ncbi:small ligand-binding sensory domain FIST [Streptomyces sp. SAI-170]
MPDALSPDPVLIDGPVSMVRLHGEACLFCGAVNKTLRAAGHVVVRGSTRVWQVVTCGCRSKAAAA